MADNGQFNPPDHITIPPTDHPTILQHMGGAVGGVAAVTAHKN